MRVDFKYSRKCRFQYSTECVSVRWFAVFERPRRHFRHFEIMVPVLAMYGLADESSVAAGIPETGVQLRRVRPIVSINKSFPFFIIYPHYLLQHFKTTV